jgi:uncharacterized membrane protein YdjX (TVP38/TMEM64 family)
MTAWSAAPLRWSTKAVIAIGLLAALLVAAVPAALVVGLVMMLFGHVVGGLALFGASILAAAAAVLIAGFSSVRELRRLIRQQLTAWQRGTGQGGAGEPGDRPGYRVVRLDRADYDRN